MQKASKVRKNGQMFGPKMFVLILFLRNAARSTPIKHGSNSPAYKMRKKRQKKKEEREKKEEKWGIKLQKNKTKKKTTPCAYIFPP